MESHQVVRTWDNAGVKELSHFLLYAPKRQANWDEALQFLQLLETLAFGDRIWVPSFELQDVEEERAEFFDQLTREYTQSRDVFSAFSPSGASVLQTAAHAASDIQRFIEDPGFQDVLRQVRVAGRTTGPGSVIDEEQRHARVHDLITGGLQRPVDEIVGECLAKRDGITELMLLAHDGRLLEALRAEYGQNPWSANVTAKLTLRTRAAANAWYRREGNEDTAHLYQPAPTRADILRNDRLSFAKVLSRDVFQRLNPAEQKRISDLGSVTNALVDPTGAPDASAFTIPLQIVMGFNADDPHRFRRMVDAALELAAKHKLIAADAREFDCLTAARERGMTLKEFEKDRLEQLSAAYATVRTRGNQYLRSRIVPWITELWGAAKGVLGTVLERDYGDLGARLEELIKGFSSLRGIRRGHALYRLSRVSLNAPDRDHLASVLGIKDS